MEKLYIKNPIYPIFSFLASLGIFIFGILISKSMSILYFLLALSLLYGLFGYAKPLIQGLFIFSVIGAIVGLGAFASSGQFEVGLQTFGRVLLLAYASIVMVAMPPIDLTRNLTQLKVPRILTLGMLITVRFIPLLIEEAHQIRMAMKTRGLHGLKHNFESLYRAFLMPFVMRLISISDMMSISLETRAFSMTDKRATVYKPVRLKWRDLSFLSLLCLIMIGVSHV